MGGWVGGRASWWVGGWESKLVGGWCVSLSLFPYIKTFIDLCDMTLQNINEGVM